MVKVYAIKSDVRTIEAIDLPEAKLPDQIIAILGGISETARRWADGTRLFTDESFLLKPQKHFFAVAGREVWLGGNGVVLGPERSHGYDPPGFTFEWLRSQVEWGEALSRQQRRLQERQARKADRATYS